MSKHREQLRVAAALDDVVAACDRAFPPLVHLAHEEAWQRFGATARATVSEGRTVLSRLFSTTNPTTVEVVIAAHEGEVQVDLDGRNLGIGPIQDRHVRAVVRALAGRMQAEVARVLIPVARPSAPEPAAPSVPAASVPAATQPHTLHSSTARPTSVPGSDWGEGRIFVSYRRDDTGYVTDAVCDRLAAAFGRGAIFKDIDSIPLGVDFRQHLTEAVQRCDVLLAVIGRDWLEPGEDGKTPRLFSERDFVRIELEAALSRRIPVIPVLVRIDALPKEELLPEPLKELVYFNGLAVRREPDFDGDVERLRKTLAQILAPST